MDEQLEDLPRTKTTRGSGYVPDDEPIAVPDSLEGMAPTTWELSQYAPAGLAGTSAKKLASSAVAPLVAKAHGYRTVTSANYAELADEAGFSDSEKRRHRPSMVSKSEATPHDGLFMPWYSPKTLMLYREGDADELTPDMVQFRPSHPIRSRESGKPIKYVFAHGAKMVFGIHPATPIDWVNDRDVPVLLAEGMLKGDSAFSAWLLDNGVDAAELADATFMDTADQAQAQLGQLMTRIAPERRLVILTAASATTFLKDTDSWMRVPFKKREVWLGIDADVATNPMVWRSAYRIRQRLLEKESAASMKLLAPHIADDTDEAHKAGLDDYLAQYGSWSTLIRTSLREDFPEPPEDDTAGMVEGDTRVAPDGCSIQQLRFVKDPEGNVVDRIWIDASIPLGGRQMAREVVRMPEPVEIESGQVLTREDPANTRVAVEVAWKAGGEKRSDVITGPLSMLSSKPEAWAEASECKVPADIQEQPYWPPRGDAGVKFLQAIKRTRRAEVDNVVRWNRMGWVPAEDADPGFIIGDQIIAASPDAEAQIRPGFDETVVPHFGDFGVGGWASNRIEPDYTSPMYCAQVLADLRTIVRLFITSKPWTDPDAPAVVLGAALRPVIPVRPKPTLFIVGEKGGGKSWTAGCAMRFWGRVHSSWADSLPGSASDTAAATEHAVSRAPIWVLDDLAPSVSDQKAKAQEAAIEDIIRNVFNGSSRSRMKADMGTRASNTPMAQLIITAENETSTPSARERTVTLRIGKGALNPSRAVTNDMTTVLAKTGVAARLSEHLIRYVMHWGEAEGWSSMHEQLRGAIAQNETIAVALMEAWAGPAKDLKRAASIAADMSSIQIVISRLLAEFKKMIAAGELADEPRAGEMSVDEMRRWFSNTEAGMLGKLTHVVHQAKTGNSDQSKGRSIIRAISSLLSAKKAFIESVEDPANPPFKVGENAFEEGTGVMASMMTDAQVNMALGWEPDSEGEWRHRGDSIGQYAVINNTPVVLLHEDNAFNLAKREHPSLIVPGQKAKETWAAVWDEALSAEYLSRQSNRGAAANSWRSRRGGVQVRGVPIDLDVILRGGALDPDDDEPED